MTPSLYDQPPVSRRSLWIRILLPLVIIAMGAGLGRYFLETRPSAQRRPAVQATPLVTVLSLQKEPAVEQLFLMGTVVAEKEVDIRSPLAGTLIFMSEDFFPGGHVDGGDLMLKVDPSDFRIAVDRAAAAVNRAVADLDLEKGRAAMAKAEVKTLEGLTGQSLAATELTLRKPQMRQMEAALASARADLEMAEIQLERTRIRAPFDGVLTRRSVVAGSRVSAGEVLASLAGRDVFWIEARIPLDRTSVLRTRNYEKGPSHVRIRTAGGERQGRVFQILPDITENTRMARMLVSVEDPLSLKTPLPSLFLGDFLSMEVEGRRFEEGFFLPHGSLREGRQVWVVDGENRLRFVVVNPLFTDKRGVYIAPDLEEGSLLVISDLGLAVEGMTVETEIQGSPSFPGEAMEKGSGKAPRRSEKPEKE
ncbi:efflux RND transporter periplasmic adaptor subunit [Desulfobotulus mexicanus]|uniref:Efflux RND transporter periplasmic adaptor subunit n=1 Tax=Desulfobotulus mexicanus TaxID=2586642 RepID=A0A5S5MD92_9BACT|nr:efflux RND transporter periplasmic adaptor subunit [Desulfobotulus mexicanus]TYT73660.1 efflux RND transporter periplasmic adaptor subunit [Desulfobotulus mexicanus]